MSMVPMAAAALVVGVEDGDAGGDEGRQGGHPPTQIRNRQGPRHQDRPQSQPRRHLRIDFSFDLTFSHLVEFAPAIGGGYVLCFASGLPASIAS